MLLYVFLFRKTVPSGVDGFYEGISTGIDETENWKTGSYHWQVPLKTTAVDLDAMDILSYQHDITFGVDTTVSDYWCWMFGERREIGEARPATFFS